MTTNLPTEPDPAESGGETMICPSCHAPNAPDARSCVECAAPLDTLATLGPLGQIEAQGFVLRHATTGKPAFIVVLGIWLLFFPMLLICIGFGCLFIYDREYRSFAGKVDLAFIWGFAVFRALMLYKTTANYSKQRNA